LLLVGCLLLVLMKKLVLTRLVIVLFQCLQAQQTSLKKYIFFKKGQIALTQKQKEELNHWLSTFPLQNYRMEISGYADTVGASSVNLILSKKRAEATAKWITKSVKLAAAPEIKYFGESHLPFPLHSVKNRCVLVQLMPVTNDMSAVEQTAVNKDNPQTDSNKVFERDTFLILISGTRIDVDSGTFFRQTIGEIEFEIKEIFSLCEMLKNNFVTRDTNGNCVISSGIMLIKAYYLGREIQPVEKKSVRISIPKSRIYNRNNFQIQAKTNAPNGKFIWKKPPPGCTTLDSTGSYYVFKVDSLFDNSINTPIDSVKCQKTRPEVKIPKLSRVKMIQIYPGKKYLSIAENKSKRIYRLDELKYAYNPMIILMGYDKNNFPQMFMARLNKLPYKKRKDKFVVKKKYLTPLLPDYTGKMNPEDYICEVLNKLEENSTWLW